MQIRSTIQVTTKNGLYAKGSGSATIKYWTHTFVFPIQDFYSSRAHAKLHAVGLQYRHRRRINTEDKAKVVAAVWGTEVTKFLATLAICHQDDLKKRINRITATWRSVCFEKMANHHTKPPPWLSKNECSPNKFSSSHPCC